MPWDALGFLTDYGIPHERQRPGWVNIRCPMCEDRSANGGFYLEDGHYHCWRCKGHGTAFVVARLLGRTVADTRKIHDKYERYTKVAFEAIKRGPTVQTFEPPGVLELSKYHRAYLEKRGFDPDRLQAEWDIRATGPLERCFGMEWGPRVVIPIKDASGRVVAAQGRDITGKSKHRYLGTPIEKSLADYKDTLYGAHKVQGDTVYVVEGVFDAWRLGPGFVCTFGTTLSNAQRKELRKWRNVGFIFDPEPQAQAQAKKYAQELHVLGIDAELIQLEIGDRDPGDLSQAEAGQIRVELGMRATW